MIGETKMAFEKAFAAELKKEFESRKLDAALLALFTEEFPLFLNRNKTSLSEFIRATRPGAQEIATRDFLHYHRPQMDAAEKASIDGALMYATRHACQNSGECATVAEILLGGELEKLLAKPKGMDGEKFTDFCRELASEFAVFIGGKISGGISAFVEMKGLHETFASFFLMSTPFGEFAKKHQLESKLDIYKLLVAALENVRQSVLEMKSVDAKKAFPQPMAIFGKPTDAAIFKNPSDVPKGTVKR